MNATKKSAVPGPASPAAAETTAVAATAPAAPTASRAGAGRRARRAARRTAYPAAVMLLLNLVALALGVGVWQALAAAGVQGLPGPWSVAHRGGQLLANGTLEGDALASVRRVLIGFALGSALAVPVGFLMGWYPWARGLLEPYVQFFRTVPPLALIPLAIVLLGIGETPKIAVIFLAAFLACVVAAFQGVVGVDRTLIDAARVLGAGDWEIFRRVVVPAASPFLLVGMRIGLGSAWGTLVASELIAAQQGLGFRMQQAELYYDLPTIYVDLITIGVLGLLMDRLLMLVERRITRWQERR